MEKSNAFVSYRKLIILVGEGAFIFSVGRDLKKMQNERYRQRVSMKSSPSIRKTSSLNPGSIYSFVCCRTTLFNTLFKQLVRTRSILNAMIQTAPEMIVILRKKSLQWTRRCMMNQVRVSLLESPRLLSRKTLIFSRQIAMKIRLRTMVLLGCSMTVKVNMSIPSVMKVCMMRSLVNIALPRNWRTSSTRQNWTKLQQVFYCHCCERHAH